MVLRTAWQHPESSSIVTIEAGMLLASMGWRPWMLQHPCDVQNRPKKDWPKMSTAPKLRNSLSDLVSGLLKFELILKN